MKTETIEEVKSFIKRGIKPRKIEDTNIVDNAIGNLDTSIDDIIELAEVINENQFSQWLRGFTYGSTCALGGFIIGGILSNMMNNREKS